MKELLLLFLGIIFLTLAGIHFYWAFGGTWAAQGAIPVKEDGTKVLNPKILDSLLVGLGLMGFALFYLLQLNQFNLTYPNRIMTYVAWIIPSIFALRVMGDFKYIGLFKKIKSTRFAQLDNRYYIPLCSLIAILGYILKL